MQYISQHLYGVLLRKMRFEITLCAFDGVRCEHILFAQFRIKPIQNGVKGTFDREGFPRGIFSPCAKHGLKLAHKEYRIRRTHRFERIKRIFFKQQAHHFPPCHVGIFCLVRDQIVFCFAISCINKYAMVSAYMK